MDPDHHQVPVGAAAEGGRVLQAVPQPGLQLPAARHAARRGHGNEAVGIQREARHVHVPGRFTGPECSHLQELYLGPEEFCLIVAAFNILAAVFFNGLVTKCMEEDLGHRKRKRMKIDFCFLFPPPQVSIS